MCAHLHKHPEHKHWTKINLNVFFQHFLITSLKEKWTACVKKCFPPVASPLDSRFQPELGATSVSAALSDRAVWLIAFRLIGIWDCAPPSDRISSIQPPRDLNECGVREQCIVALLLSVCSGRVWLLCSRLFSLPSLSAWQIRAVTPPDPAPDSDKHCKHSVKWLRQSRSHTAEHTKPATRHAALTDATCTPEMVWMFLCVCVWGNNKVNVCLWESVCVSKCLHEPVFMCAHAPLHTCVSLPICCRDVFSLTSICSARPNIPSPPPTETSLSVLYSHRRKRGKQRLQRKKPCFFFMVHHFSRALGKGRSWIIGEACHDGWRGRNFIRNIF